MPTNTSDDSLAQALAACDEAVLASLRAIFQDLEGELSAGLNAPCDACGQCCRFDKAKHRLFVTPG